MTTSITLAADELAADYATLLGHVGHRVVAEVEQADGELCPLRLSCAEHGTPLLRVAPDGPAAGRATRPLLFDGEPVERVASYALVARHVAAPGVPPHSLMVRWFSGYEAQMADSISLQCDTCEWCDLLTRLDPAGSQ